MIQKIGIVKKTMQSIKISRKKRSFTFIDLFAGIGGMRLAFEKAGGRCVFSSEWNEYARLTYAANFGEEPEGDITKINASNIPDHDILVAGFPCQPFSLAGISKKRSLNRPVGFKDLTQGTLFFDIARIIKEKKPRVFLLENVKNLKTLDKGNAFRIITKILRDELGYDLYSDVIDAQTLVPQHRERLYMVGFNKPTEYKFPAMPDKKPKLNRILEKNLGKTYTLTDGVWTALQKHARKHNRMGNGFGYGLADLKGVSRTLSARYYKDGAEILIPQKTGLNPRRLTPRECARLMGFPEKFKIVVSDNNAYKQFGNSVVVPVVTRIAKSIVECMLSNRRRITLLAFAK